MRQLRRSNKSKFHDQLKDVLCGEEYKQWALNIDGEDLVWLVDYLDKVHRRNAFPYSPLNPTQALDSVDPTSSGYSACLRELRHICGAKMILPVSYTSLSSLVDIGRQPVASGDSGDLYEATLDGSKVCVKRIREYSKDGPGKEIQVRCPISFPALIDDETDRPSIKRLWYGNN